MSRRRTPGYIPPLPNEGSQYQTPTTLAIDCHYANLLIVERWNYDRYVRFCSFIKMTPAELASLVMMPHSWIEPYAKEKILPRRPASRAIALLLTVLEAHFLEKYTKDIVQNPFPDLTDALPKTAG